MKSSIANGLALTALISGTTAFNTFEVNFYSEDVSNTCSGNSIGIQDGPDSPGIFENCYPVPAGAQTLSIAVQDDDVDTTIFLYSDANCGGGDASGTDHPTHNSPVCLPLNGAQSIAVTELPCGNDMSQCDKKKRSSNSTELAARANPGRYDIAFGKVIAGGTFAYQAAGVCPATAKDEDVNKAQCGIAATLAVLTLFFGGFEAFGIYTKGAPDSRRAVPEILGGHVARSALMTDLRPGLPYMDTNSIPGATISFTPIEKYFDADGEEWDHWDFEGHHHSRNHTSVAKLRVHQSTGRSVAYHPIQKEMSVGRRDTGITAYYSWVNNNDQIYTTGDSTSDALADYAVQMWNELHSNNEDETCADFQLGGEQLNQGDFAILAGTYTDVSGSC